MRAHRDHIYNDLLISFIHSFIHSGEYLSPIPLRGNFTAKRCTCRKVKWTSNSNMASTNAYVCSGGMTALVQTLRNGLKSNGTDGHALGITLVVSHGLCAFRLKCAFWYHISY